MDSQAMVHDSSRYDVPPFKLVTFSEQAMKAKLKKRFVTGQSSDQIVKNLLNMSDDEEQVELNAHDKEQLTKIEANDTKVDKKEKRRKRLESQGIKIEDADADSELSE